METKVIAIRHWDDLVFENRNKEYGAYRLRRAYSKRVILAWGVSVAVFAGLLVSTQLRSGDEKKVVIPVVTCDLVQTLQPPPILEARLKPKAAPAPVKAKANTPPLVTREPVEPEPIENTAAVASDGSETGSDPVGGVPDGVGSVPVEIPAVIEPPATVSFAEHMPEFEGGNEEMIKYIVKNTRYPSSARRQEVQGTVFVRFVVMTDGSISQAEVVRGFHPDCDKEAIRVIQKMPKWIAGSQNGRPVNVRMVVPIKFKMS